MTTVPRGIRNNNPGNLNFAHQTGAVLEPGPNARFAKFRTPSAGIAALKEQLLRYQSEGISSVRGFISKWAPPNENDTTAYIQAVSQAMGVTPDAKISLNSPGLLAGLMNAIIKFENGINPYRHLVAQSVGGGMV